MIDKGVVKVCCQACINSYEGQYGKVIDVFKNMFKFREAHVEGHYGYLDKKLVIVFRGSDGIRDWLDNLKFWKKEVSKINPYHGVNPDIEVHAGFINQYKMIRSMIHDIITANKTANEVVFTGHSLGGALATLASVDIQYNFKDRHIACITFGSPRVGNKYFKKSYDRRIRRSFRFVNREDTVCKVPMPIFGYRHVAHKIQLGERRWYAYLTGWSKDHYPDKYMKHL